MEINTNELLTNTELLLNHLYWFKHDFGFEPSKEHDGVAIDYVDIKERRHDFILELRNTITSWVYSKERCRSIIDKRLSETGDDVGNAAAFLTSLARTKFRKGFPQGQFGELLLFNFLQHFFHAVPLLRKMPITTSTGHERFGADALHYLKESDTNLFYLGESKCYESDYSFKSAFKASLDSVIATFHDLDRELDLYTYESFIERELIEVAADLKAGKLSNVRFELVCLVVYNEKTKLELKSEDEIRSSIKNVIVNQCEKFEKSNWSNFDQSILQRLHFVIFPAWNLEGLLTSFENA